MSPLNATHFAMVWEAFYYGSNVAPPESVKIAARHEILFDVIPYEVITRR